MFTKLLLKIVIASIIFRKVRKLINEKINKRNEKNEKSSFVN